jgi:hypothetical protein
MQKKKPSFQAIPNYSVSGATNWNESKEVPAEQGWNDARLTGFPIAGAVVRVNCRASSGQTNPAIMALTRRSGAAWRMPMVRRNGAPFQAIPAAITATLFIECSSKI